MYILFIVFFHINITILGSHIEEFEDLEEEMEEENIDDEEDEKVRII